MGISAKIASFLGVLVSTSLLAGATQAEAVESREESSVGVQYAEATRDPDHPGPPSASGAEVLESPGARIAALEQEAQDQNAALAREMKDISIVGSELEEAQARVRGARARVRELGGQTSALEGDLEARREILASSRARYEESVQAAYTGDDLEDLTSFLRGIFRGEGIAALADARMAKVLFRGRETLREYRDANQVLQNTTRQLTQKEVDYEGALREESTRTKELSRRKRELDALISGLRSDRARTEARLQRLRAEEKARIRKIAPASGAGTIPQSREAVVARRSIVARSVEPVSIARFMRLYKESAREYGFAGDWYILAAVGKVESDHGENLGPSSAGALGPMQFLPSTWETSGVDGNGDGVANIMDPEDAIPAAAAYLKAGGAPQDWYAALYSYNHADWYVREVLAVAEGYRRLAKDDGVGPYA